MSENPKADTSYAWVATALCKGSETAAAISFKSGTEYEPENPFYGYMKRDLNGEALGKQFFPETLYFNDYTFRPERDLKPAMYGSHAVVNAEIAGLLRQFDLGQGNLYPVKIANWDGSEVSDRVYFILNVGNLKSAIRRGKSVGIRKLPRIDNVFLFECDKDDDPALGPEALGEPDIWRDPKVNSTIFFSARVGDAIRAAGFEKEFPMIRARILSAEEAGDE